MFMSLFKIKYDINKASEVQIFNHLTQCSELFIVPLATYVNINEYAAKIKKNAVTIEAWENEELIGLIAVYLNDTILLEGFITNVSVLQRFQKKGISKCLLLKTIELSKANNFKELKLSVYKDNVPALKLYKQNGFKKESEKENKYIMSKVICNE